MIWQVFKILARDNLPKAIKVASILLFDKKQWSQSEHKRDKDGKFSNMQGESAASESVTVQTKQNTSVQPQNAPVMSSGSNTEQQQAKAEESVESPENVVKRYVQPPDIKGGRTDKVTMEMVVKASIDPNTPLNEKKQQAHTSKQAAESATQRQIDKRLRKGETMEQIRVPRKSYFTQGVQGIRTDVADKVRGGQAVIFKNGNDDCQVVTLLDRNIGIAYDSLDGQGLDTSAVCVVYSRKNGIHYYPISMFKYQSAKQRYDSLKE